MRNLRTSYISSFHAISSSKLVLKINASFYECIEHSSCIHGTDLHAFMEALSLTSPLDSLFEDMPSLRYRTPCSSISLQRARRGTLPVGLSNLEVLRL